MRGKLALNYEPYTNVELFDGSQANLEQKKIADYLKNISFQKQYFGGVNEEDVWKKISELNALYEEAIKAERIRYDTLIETKTVSED